jgi:hypothetical protein
MRVLNPNQEIAFHLNFTECLKELNSFHYDWSLQLVPPQKQGPNFAISAAHRAQATKHPQVSFDYGHVELPCEQPAQAAFPRTRATVYADDQRSPWKHEPAQFP